MSSMLYRPRFSKQQLIEEIVPAVASAANPVDPELAPMRSWNAARAEAGYPDAPTAEAIHLRINDHGRRQISWEEILHVACSPDRDVQRSLIGWSQVSSWREYDERHVVFALGLVALRLEARTVSFIAYDQMRDQLIAADNRRVMPVGFDEILPTADQIRQFAGSWQAALHMAGLEPFQQRPARAVPRTRGMDPPAAILIFVEYNDRFPTLMELRRYLQACDTALTGFEGRGETWTQQLEKAEAALRAEGKPVPPRPKVDPGRPKGRGNEEVVYPPGRRIPGAVSAYDVRHDIYWTRERVVDCLAAYLSILPPGQEPRTRHYQTLTPKYHWASYEIVRRHGKFQALIAEARSR